MGSSPTYLDPVAIPLVEGPAILDIGCGFGRWGCICRSNYWETHCPQPGAQPVIIGMEGFLPNAHMAARSGCYAGLVHGLFPPLPFRDRSFDTVLLMEVLEHFEADKVGLLVREAQRVARRRVVLSTPNRPSLRGAIDTITGRNPLESHLSYTTRPELRRMGFRLFGAGLAPGPARLRILLHRLHLLEGFDAVVRPALSSLSLHAPSLSDSVVGLWLRPNGAGLPGGRG